MRFCMSLMTYLCILEIPMSLSAEIKARLHSEKLSESCKLGPETDLWLIHWHRRHCVCLEEKPRNKPVGHSALGKRAAHNFMQPWSTYESQSLILAPWVHLCLLHLWKLDPTSAQISMSYQPKIPYTNPIPDFDLDFILIRPKSSHLWPMEPNGLSQDKPTMPWPLILHPHA